MEAIIQAVRDAGGARVFELRAADGAPLPPYEPGAHIDVILGNGLTRQYSLCCSTPSPAAYRIAVKREPQSRGGSAWLHEHAGVGTALRLGAPRNAFALAPQAAMHMLFAGGIGVTPILSMAYALLRQGQPFRMAYYARDEASIAFAEELRTGPLAGMVQILVGQDPEQTADSIRVQLASLPVADSHVYVCGPAPFMNAVVAQATRVVGAAAVHQESFGGAPAAAGREQPFVLVLRRSGREVPVPAEKTALACLQEAGVELDCSCEVGVCGTCRTTVMEGTPEHLDTVLSEQEREANDCFMPCVSRARTAVLVVDL